MNRYLPQTGKTLPAVPSARELLPKLPDPLRESLVLPCKPAKGMPRRKRLLILLLLRKLLLLRRSVKERRMEVAELLKLRDLRPLLHKLLLRIHDLGGIYRPKPFRKIRSDRFQSLPIG